MYFLVLPQQSCLLGLCGRVLLYLLSNTGKYSPSCQTNTKNQLFQYCSTRKDNTGSITFRNWEYLYYDLSWDIRWNIAWALAKSLDLRPWDFPRAQAIFHRISLLLSLYSTQISQFKSQYRHSHLLKNGSAAVVSYVAVTAVGANVNVAVAVELDAWVEKVLACNHSKSSSHSH